ncbi:hypothetical protein ACFWTE_26635 [Nocardiopsis sp. NPDC058631]|uniref:hypothetical protein n=1 Tax=Nocardiopsis sp. NPDC058631 TaxID=3346566 RepID=UPI003655F556
MLIRRLRNLALLEHANIVLIAVVLLGSLDMPAGPANTAGLGLVALLLLEGGTYWWLKVHQLSARAPRPAGLGLFRALGRLNLVLFALGGAVIVGAWATGASGAHLWPGVALWGFAVLEHVNYFHLQLSHQSRADLARLRRTRRLHPSPLARDLHRHRTRLPYLR